MDRPPEAQRDHDLLVALCRELNLLARQEDDAAAAEASLVPYWRACPPSVVGHRAAARTLRTDAHRLERRTRPSTTP